MYITDDIRYVGVNDHKLDLFEGQYPVPDGMAYNSYIIIDEKIAVMDSVEISFAEEWIGNIKAVLGNRKPDYLVVQHMEPDHSSSIAEFVKAFPNAKIVSSAKAFAIMKNFFGTDFAQRQIVVGENSTLSLGRHNLTFITAPMVHWPEVIMTYDSTDKVIFTADAFGKFGTLDVEEEWLAEARRYYIGIVGKYGAQVQSLLKKLANFEIETICSLHGPVLKENIDYYIDLYSKWSSYQPEEKGVLVAYTSIYGNTEKAAKAVAEKLLAKGCPKVEIRDIARCDMFEAVGQAFRFDKMVLATTTYNNAVFPFMAHFIDHIAARGFANRTVALVENGSWAPAAAKLMKAELEKCRNITFAENVVKIHSAMDEANLAQTDALVEELCADY